MLMPNKIVCASDPLVEGLPSIPSDDETLGNQWPGPLSFGRLLALHSMAMDRHVERAEFSSSVVNLSYWKPRSTGAALLFLFKQAITPLHHFHQEKGKISPSCEFQEEILETGKSLRQEVIKTAPSSGNKKP